MSRTTASVGKKPPDQRISKTSRTELKYHPNFAALARHAPAASFSSAPRFPSKPKPQPSAAGINLSQTTRPAKSADGEQTTRIRDEAAAERHAKLLARGREIRREILQRLHAIRRILSELQVLNSSSPQSYTPATFAQTEAALFTARAECRSVEQYLRSEEVKTIVDRAAAAETTAVLTQTRLAQRERLKAGEAIDFGDGTDVPPASGGSPPLSPSRKRSRFEPPPTPTSQEKAAAEEAARLRTELQQQQMVAAKKALAEEEEEYGGTDAGRARAAARESEHTETDRINQTLADDQRVRRQRMIDQWELRRDKSDRKEIEAAGKRAYQQLLHGFLGLKSMIEEVAGQLLTKHKEQIWMTKPKTGVATDRQRLQSQIYHTTDLTLTRNRIPVAAIGPPANAQTERPVTHHPSTDENENDTVPAATVPSANPSAAFASSLAVVDKCLMALSILKKKFRSPLQPRSAAAAGACPAEEDAEGETNERMLSTVAQLTATLTSIRDKMRTLHLSNQQMQSQATSPPAAPPAVLPESGDQSSADAKHTAAARAPAAAGPGPSANAGTAIAQMSQQLKILDGVMRDCIEVMTELLVQSASDLETTETAATIPSVGAGRGRGTSFAAKPFGSSPSPSTVRRKPHDATRDKRDAGLAEELEAERTRTRELYQILSQLSAWSADSTSEHRRRPAPKFSTAARFPSAKPADADVPEKYRRRFTESEIATPNVGAVKPRTQNVVIPPPVNEEAAKDLDLSTTLTTDQMIRWKRRRERRRKERLGPGRYDATDRAVRKHTPGVVFGGTEGQDKSKTVPSAKTKPVPGPGAYFGDDHAARPRIPAPVTMDAPVTARRIPPKKRFKVKSAFGEPALDPTQAVRPHKPIVQFGPEDPSILDAASKQQRIADRRERERMQKLAAAVAVTEARLDQIAQQKRELAEANGLPLVRPSPAFAEPSATQPKARHLPMPEGLVNDQGAQVPAELPLPQPTIRKPVFRYRTAGDDAARARRRIQARYERRQAERRFRRLSIRAAAEDAAAYGDGGGASAPRGAGAPNADASGAERKTHFSAHTGRPELFHSEIDRRVYNAAHPATEALLGHVKRGRHSAFGTADTGRGLPVGLSDDEKYAPRDGDNLLLRPNPDVARIASVGSRAHSFARTDRVQTTASDTEVDGLWADREGDTLKLDTAPGQLHIRKRIPSYAFRTAVSDDEYERDRWLDDQPVIILRPNYDAVEPKPRAAFIGSADTGRLQPPSDPYDFDSELVLHPNDELTRKRTTAGGAISFDKALPRVSSDSKSPAVSPDVSGRDGDRLDLDINYSQIDADIPTVKIGKSAPYPPESQPEWKRNLSPAPALQPETADEKRRRADEAAARQKGMAWKLPTYDKSSAPTEAAPDPNAGLSPSAVLRRARREAEDFASLAPVSAMPGHGFSQSKRSLWEMKVSGDGDRIELQIDEQHTKKTVAAVGFTRSPKKGLDLNPNLLTKDAEMLLPDWSQREPHVPTIVYPREHSDRFPPTAPVPYSTPMSYDLKAVTREPRAAAFGSYTQPRLIPRPDDDGAPEPLQPSALSISPAVQPPTPREHLDNVLDGLLASDHISAHGKVRLSAFERQKAAINTERERRRRETGPATSVDAEAKSSPAATAVSDADTDRKRVTFGASTTTAISPNPRLSFSRSRTSTERPFEFDADWTSAAPSANWRPPHPSQFVSTATAAGPAAESADTVEYSEVPDGVPRPRRTVSPTNAQRQRRRDADAAAPGASSVDAEHALRLSREEVVGTVSSLYRAKSKVKQIQSRP